MAKRKYEVIARVIGQEVGAVVELDADMAKIPRIYRGRVRPLPKGVAATGDSGQAEKIIEAAKAEAEKIVADAKAEAEKIVADAKANTAPPPPKK